MKFFPLAALLLCPLLASAQLAVTVSAPKVTGSKVVVKLEMKNNFAEKVESAKAVVFLLDDQGKIVGQSTKWVIGGTTDRPALEPKSGTTFNFVIPATKPFTATNLAARVSFSRAALEGGKLANVTKDVRVQEAIQ